MICQNLNKYFHYTLKSSVVYGTRLASASHDRTIKLWNTTSGKVLITLKGHREQVNAVSFNPDGTRLASASTDTAILWNFDFENLLSSSCNLLNDYMVTRPNVMEELKFCQEIIQSQPK